MVITRRPFRLFHHRRAARATGGLFAAARANPSCERPAEDGSRFPRLERLHVSSLRRPRVLPDVFGARSIFSITPVVGLFSSFLCWSASDWPQWHGPTRDC